MEAAVAGAARKTEEENERLRALARPILRPGQAEDEGTTYGMPCNDEGPCDAGNATEWRLYSYRDGKLVRHKGYRSSSYGTTFAELISDYMRGEPDVEEVLRNLPSDAHRKGKQDPVLEAVGGDSEMAHRAKEFAETARQCVGGNVSRALRVLERESTAPYGRARRQAAIEQNIPGIREAEAGQRFWVTVRRLMLTRLLQERWHGCGVSLLSRRHRNKKLVGLSEKNDLFPFKTHLPPLMR